MEEKTTTNISSTATTTSKRSTQSTTKRATQKTLTKSGKIATPTNSSTSTSQPVSKEPQRVSVFEEIITSDSEEEEVVHPKRANTIENGSVASSTKTIQRDKPPPAHSAKLRERLLARATVPSESSKPTYLQPLSASQRQSFQQDISVAVHNGLEQAKLLINGAERFMTRFNLHAQYRNPNNSSIPPILDCVVFHQKFFSHFLPDREEFMENLRSEISNTLMKHIPGLLDKLDEEFNEVHAHCWNLTTEYSAILRQQLENLAEQHKIPNAHAADIITETLSQFESTLNSLCLNNDVRELCNMEPLPDSQVQKDSKESLSIVQPTNLTPNTLSNTLPYEYSNNSHIRRGVSLRPPSKRLRDNNGRSLPRKVTPTYKSKGGQNRQPYTATKRTLR